MIAFHLLEGKISIVLWHDLVSFKIWGGRNLFTAPGCHCGFSVHWVGGALLQNGWEAQQVQNGSDKTKYSMVLPRCFKRSHRSQKMTKCAFSVWKNCLNIPRPDQVFILRLICWSCCFGLDYAGDNFYGNSRYIAWTCPSPRHKTYLSGESQQSQWSAHRHCLHRVVLSLAAFSFCGGEKSIDQARRSMRSNYCMYSYTFTI